MEKTNRLSDRIFKNKLFVKASTALTAVYYGMLPVYCDGADIFNAASGGLTNLFNQLWTVASKLLPVAIAICIISLFVTHDERKIETEKRLLVAMVVAFALLYLIHKNTSIMETTMQTLFG